MTAVERYYDAMSKGFMTGNSGAGIAPKIVIEFRSLSEMQEAYSALIDLAVEERDRRNGKAE